MKILGIDPGGSTGWANIEVNNKIISLGIFGVTKDMTLVTIGDQIRDTDIVVYEGFWLRPDKARRGDFDWQSNSAEQVIGSLMTLCNLFQKQQVVKQQPSQRVPGYAFAGMKYVKGKKGQHSQDALAHAVYYAVKVLRALPVSVKRD